MPKKSPLDVLAIQLDKLTEVELGTEDWGRHHRAKTGKLYAKAEKLIQ